MKQSIRLAHADVARAIQAIYAPVVSHTPISLETTPPSIEEMSQRIAIALADLPPTLSMNHQFKTPSIRIIRYE